MDHLNALIAERRLTRAALGPRPAWWRFRRRRDWDQQEAVLCLLTTRDLRRIATDGDHFVSLIKMIPSGFPGFVSKVRA